MAWRKSQRYVSVYAVAMFGQPEVRKSPRYAQSARAHTGIGQEGGLCKHFSYFLNKKN